MHFIYLLFAHLVGDFVLQSLDLVKLKKKSNFGIFIHTIIHFTVSFFVLFSINTTNTKEILIAVIFVSLMHFLIDKSKIEYEKRSTKRVFPYIFDQFLHLLVLIIASIYLSLFFEISFNPLTNFYLFASGLIIVSQGIEIFYFQKNIENTSKRKLKPNLKTLKFRILVYTFLYLLINIFGIMFF